MGKLSVVFTTPLWLLPDDIMSWVATDGDVAVAANVRGLPVSPADVAVTVYAPAALPSVKTVDACPLEPVVALVSVRLCPVAPVGTVAIANVTGVPDIGLPYPSVTVTTYGLKVVPATAVWPVPAVDAMF